MKKWVVCVGTISHVFHSRRERAHEPFHKWTYSRSRPLRRNFLSRQAATVTLSFPVYIWSWTSIVWTWDGLGRFGFELVLSTDASWRKDQFVTFLLDPITPVGCFGSNCSCVCFSAVCFCQFFFNLALTLLSVNINIWQRIPASFYKRIYHYINKRLN